MKLQMANLPRLIAELRSSVILGMVIIAMLWTGIGLKYVEDVDSACGPWAYQQELRLGGIPGRTCCAPSARSTRRYVSAGAGQTPGHLVFTTIVSTPTCWWDLR
jgi:hypothetical protein